MRVCGVDSRDTRYDVLKALGVIMMLSSHAYAPIPLRHFFCTFHMAVFFILAGWFFDFRHAESFGSCVVYWKKRMVRLWWPIFFWSGSFMLLHNLFAKMRLIHELPFFFGVVPDGYVAPQWSLGHMLLQLAQAPLMLGDGTRLTGAFWFLKTLLFATVWYCVASWILKQLKCSVFKWQCVIAAAALVVSAFVKIPYAGIFGGDQTLTAYALMHIGVTFRHFDLRIERLNAWGKTLAALFCFLVLAIMSRYGVVTLALNEYPSILFLLVSSVCGWYFLLIVSGLLKNVCMGVFTYIGAHTLPIVLLHYLAFKIVSYVGVCYYSVDLSHLAEMGSAFHFGAWWLVYVVVGVGVPLIGSAVVLRIKWVRSVALLKRTV